MGPPGGGGDALAWPARHLGIFAPQRQCRLKLWEKTPETQYCRQKSKIVPTEQHSMPQLALGSSSQRDERDRMHSQQELLHKNTCPDPQMPLGTLPLDASHLDALPCLCRFTVCCPSAGERHRLAYSSCSFLHERSSRCATRQHSMSPSAAGRRRLRRVVVACMARQCGRQRRQMLGPP